MHDFWTGAGNWTALRKPMWYGRQWQSESCDLGWLVAMAALPAGGVVLFGEGGVAFLWGI